MDFASQAHRDKLNLKFKTLICLLPVARHPSGTNQSRSHYGSRCEPGAGELQMDWSVARVKLRTQIVFSEGSRYWGLNLSDPRAGPE
jgi:hypothetical protein